MKLSQETRYFLTDNCRRARFQDNPTSVYNITVAVFISAVTRRVRVTVPADPEVVAALFEACDEAGSGEVPVGRLLTHVQTQLPGLCR